MDAQEDECVAGGRTGVGSKRSLQIQQVQEQQQKSRVLVSLPSKMRGLSRREQPVMVQRAVAGCL